MLLTSDREANQEKSSSSDDEDDNKTENQQRKKDGKYIDDESSRYSGKIVAKANMIDFSEFNNFIEFIISRDN